MCLFYSGPWVAEERKKVKHSSKIIINIIGNINNISFVLSLFFNLFDLFSIDAVLANVLHSQFRTKINEKPNKVTTISIISLILIHLTEFFRRLWKPKIYHHNLKSNLLECILN
jgi:hypothetical protein